MPLPTRAASTRIPSSKSNNVTTARNASPTKQISTGGETKVDGHSSGEAPQQRPSRYGTRSHTSSKIGMPSDPLRGETDLLQHDASNWGSRSLQPSSDNGNAGSSSLVRAKSLRKPPQTNSGPPTSFRMPTRLAQPSAATGPTQSSSSRDHARHVSESSAKGDDRRRSSSLGAKSRRSSSSNDPRPWAPQTPRAESRTRPPSSSSQPPRRPTSASSTSTPSYSVSRRTDFSANQQRFNSPSKPPVTATDRPRPTMEQTRQQMHLLHLNILHSSAERTLANFSESARKRLEAQHLDLKDLYETSLQLSRVTREQRNLLALTRWTNGNMAVLERKLSTLCAILEEISRLTTPMMPHDAEGDELGAETHQGGPYAQLTEQFTAWVSYVLEVWEERDAMAQRISEGIISESEYDNVTAIEGLGDGIKATVRQLSDAVNALVIRMEDIRAVPVPNIDLSTALNNHDNGKATSPPTTPAVLVDYAGTLLDCMAEELQLMREIEFEVVIGEKAWVDERMRRAQAEMDGGFSTPRSFRDVFS